MHNFLTAILRIYIPHYFAYLYYIQHIKNWVLRKFHAVTVTKVLNSSKICIKKMCNTEFRWPAEPQIQFLFAYMQQHKHLYFNIRSYFFGMT